MLRGRMVADGLARNGRNIPLTACLLAALAVGALAGCGKRQVSLPDPVTTSSLKEPVSAAAVTCEGGWTAGLRRSASSGGVPRELLHARPLHAAGDVVRLDIVEGVEFSGVYKINLDGYVTLPYAASIRAAGLTTPELTANIRQTFIDKGLLRPDRADLSVVPVEWAPVQVRVTGAVFQPGRGLINNTQRNMGPQAPPIGDSPAARFLDAAIKVAVGVRPDADLSRIALYRTGRKFTVDLSGIVEGTPVPDIYLMHGDQIDIPSTGCNQEALARPSQVTPADVRIFISNVVVPTTGHPEPSASVVPYGTRLLAAAISGNCVGGTHLTNASRRIAHVATNPGTGKAKVTEIPVREMMERPNDFSANPYLMPNDAIACFDSEMTNLRDAVSTIQEILSTVGLAIALF